MPSPVASDDLIVFHYEPYPGAAAVAGVRQVRPDKVAKGSDLPELGLHPDHWYLTGLDIKSGNHRTYRLDRMWSASCPPGGRADAPARKPVTIDDTLKRLLDSAAGVAAQPWQRQLMDELDRIDISEKRKHEWSPLTQSGERFPEDFWEPARTAFSRPVPPSSSKL